MTSEAASEIGGGDRQIRPHPSAGRGRKRWSAREVAELVELAFSTGWHAHRVRSRSGLDRDRVPFEARAEHLAELLETGGRR